MVFIKLFVKFIIFMTAGNFCRSEVYPQLLQQIFEIKHFATKVKEF